MWRLVRQRLQKVFVSGGFRQTQPSSLDLEETTCQACSCNHSHDAEICISKPIHHGRANNSGSEEKCAEDEWQRYFRHNFSSRQHCALEAIGWGSAVAVGLHLSHMWHDLLQWRMKRREERYNRWHQYCPWRMYATAKSVLEFDGGDKPTGQSVHRVSECITENTKHQNPLVFVTSTGHVPASNAAGFSSSADISEPLHVIRQFGMSQPSQRKSIDDNMNDTYQCSTQSEKSSTGEIENEWEEMTRLLDGYALNAEAVNLAAQNKNLEAIAMWTKAANELSCNKAFYNLGVAYQCGRGVKQDNDKALAYFLKASEAGHIKASFNAAMILLEQDYPQQRDQAQELLEQAAECGLTEAQIQLAALYLENNTNLEKAVNLLSIASNQGHMPSKYLLALCYERGLGTEENGCAAAELYKQAAQAGHVDATYNLAVFFERGLGGLPMDKNAALSLYSRAVELGDTMATVDVERLRTDIMLQSGNASQQHKPLLQKRRVDDKSLPHVSLALRRTISDTLINADGEPARTGQKKPNMLEDTNRLDSCTVPQNIRFFVGDASPNNLDDDFVDCDDKITFRSQPFHRALASENNLALLVN